MNDTQCLFCKLANDPGALIWENAKFAAFNDIHPKDRVHVLVAPKNHVENFDQLSKELSPDMVEAVQEVARFLKVDGGYRIQVNVGRAGGQEIDHLHVHLLAK